MMYYNKKTHSFHVHANKSGWNAGSNLYAFVFSRDIA